METLKLFVLVSDERSFSAAGRKLYITPSAVIQKMQQLEAEIGAQLFIRKYNGISLTQEGAAFYRGAQSMLQTYEETLGHVEKIKEDRLNTINICMHTVSLMPAYKEFVQKNTAYSCNYAVFQENGVNEAFEQFMNHDNQVIEWPALSALAERGVAFLKRYRAPVCCVVSRHSPYAKVKSISLAQLAGEDVLVYSHPNQEVIEEALTRVLAENGIDNVAYKSIYGEPNLIIKACRDNSIVLVSEAYARTLPLVAIPLTPALTVDFGLAYKKEASRAVRDFIAFIEEYDKRHGVAY